MSALTLIGFTAAMLSTLAFLPQAVKTWRTRQTRDISLGTFLLIVTGNFLWIVYAWLDGDAPVLITNIVIFCLAGSILYLKVRQARAK